MISFLLLLICPHPPEEMLAQNSNIQLEVEQSTLDMDNDIKNILREAFNNVLPFLLKVHSKNVNIIKSSVPPRGDTVSNHIFDIQLNNFIAALREERALWFGD